MSLKMIQLSSQEEWLEHRKNGIGGSEASSIIGLNPYKTNVQLWQEKVGLSTAEDISDKPYVKYGHDAEPLLRQLFALDFPEYEVGYTENNSYKNDEFPFALASLDGTLIEKETGRKGILEIKTTNILQSMQKEKWNNQIPDNYYVQVLWYLMVTGWDFAVLVGQLKSEFQDGTIYKQTKHYKIERADVEEDIRILRQKGAEFWNCVQNRIEPPLILPPI